MKYTRTLNKAGFTLIELLMVITVIGILAGITYSNLGPNGRNKANYARSIAELGAISNGMKLYVAKYNDFPPDAERKLPNGIEEFVQGQESLADWPDAPFPGSVYDWENWPAGTNGPQHTYQISIRFCDAGQSDICKANAKKYLGERLSQDILDSWDANSSMYYCIKGSCRSHQDNPVSHPGFCVNCGDGKAQVY